MTTATRQLTLPAAARRGPVSRQTRVLLLLAAALAIITLVAAAAGAVPIPLLDSLLGGEPLSDLEATVLWEIRLPRVLLAAFVGAALAVTGASLQGLFRNPLAEPQLIGVSGGAALGAVAMIVMGSALALPDAVRPFSLPLAAFAGALAVTGALYWFSARRAGAGIATLLLVGVAINALAAVGIGAFTYLSDDGQLRTLTFWTLGSFASADWAKLLPAAGFITLAVAVLLREGRRLDLLQLGEAEARHLGVDVPRLKRRVVFAGAAAVGAGVAVSGIIGFIGLVVPHLVRLIGGVHHRFLLPGSALFGAALAVTSDIGARTIIVPAELPVGLLTSAIGAPFFLWLIIRLKR
jgi:iron complex transport system permease protein